jgi:hypothetical protein
MTFFGQVKEKIVSKYNSLGNRVYKVRKQNWSAPAIMTAFIITCMLLIYGMERVGLMNKEKNLVYRDTSPEKLIKVISNNKVKVEPSMRVYVTDRSRDEYVEDLRYILMNGAESQLYYLNQITVCENNLGSLCEKEFFDL